MVGQEAQQALDVLNTFLGGVYKLAIIAPKDASFAPVNARFMTNAQFRQLVGNIQADGALASVPLCWKMPDGEFRVLSGNHRVKAAQEAGIERMLVLYTDENLTKSRELSIQVSHNSIVGQDDMAVLKQIWSDIRAVEDKLYSGVDDKTLEEMANTNMPSLAEVRLEMVSATFWFLQDELDRLKETFNETKKLCTSKELFLNRWTEHDKMLDALDLAGDAYDIRNTATQLMTILDVFERNKEDLNDGWYDAETGQAKHRRGIPLGLIFGRTKIPSEEAAAIKKAVDRMVDCGKIAHKERWRILLELANE